MRAIKFLGSNSAYIIWFLIYFGLAWAILGSSWNSFIIVSIIYGISITIALSPMGEALLRITENCREPATEQERNYLIPMFEEVYQNAKEVNPKLNDNIQLYIMDAMYVNAFAIGRKTIALTRGAIETFTAEELKGILAHELGHIIHGHTKALLLSVIGNFFFSVIVWFFRAILYIVQLICSVVANSGISIVFTVIAFIVRIVFEASVFVFINVSQIILALNSRANEIQADTFAYDVGYGRELTSGLYLLQKISMGTKLRLSERMKASHPHTAHRIENLERLENEAMEV